jgi:serine/threonine protein kinase/Flp pilus assembly protein TadD
VTPQQFKQAQSVYFELCELPREQWAARLPRLCGDDSAVRELVLGLVEHADRAAGFLESPPLPAALAAALSEWSLEDLSGTACGPYRLVRRIAAGGMGTVYEGQRDDGQFTQRVAIKLVKRGMDSDEILRRFWAERQVLAALSHPNVGRLLDGGATAEGRPYLVMEYVEGLPIDEYCDRNRLSVVQRLRLFRTVCDAVHYAHRNLVVHRDLKPSNILVGADGAPKLLDFGIAKVLSNSATDQTAAGERRLTPEYASPEQIEGRSVTTATDIYSLGVVLYELLTGHRPYYFRTRSTAEFERVVCHQNPLPPSVVISKPETWIALDGERRWVVTPEAVSQTRDGSPERLRRRLRGDLDNIVLMALRKEPARRYASAEALAADIERYLHDLPVSARRDTLWYRSGKFIRRHAAVCSVAALLVLVAFAGVAGIAWQAGVARAQRDQAYLARDEAEAVADFFQRMLASVDPEMEGPDVKVRTILDNAAGALPAELKNRPLVQAALRSTIGKTYLRLGMLDKALEHVEAAYRQRLALLPAGHHDVAESKFDLGEVYYALGRLPEAERLLRESLATHQRLRGPENIDTARVWNDLGTVLRASRKLGEAEAAHLKALQIREQTDGRNSLNVAESLNNLAGVYRDQGRAQEARDTAAEALDIRRRLLGRHALTLQSMSNLAVMHGACRDYPAAEVLLREVLGFSDEVYGPEHHAKATLEGGLGGALLMQGRFAEAEPLYRSALERLLRTLPPDHARVVQARINLGRCLFRLGRADEAEPLLLAGVEPYLTMAPPLPPYALGCAEDLARLYESRGQPEAARPYRELLQRAGAPSTQPSAPATDTAPTGVWHSRPRLWPEWTRRVAQPPSAVARMDRVCGTAALDCGQNGPQPPRPLRSPAAPGRPIS